MPSFTSDVLTRGARSAPSDSPDGSRTAVVRRRVRVLVWMNVAEGLLWLWMFERHEDVRWAVTVRHTRTPPAHSPTDNSVEDCGGHVALKVL